MPQLDRARGSRSPEQLAAEERYDVIEPYVRPVPPDDLPEEIERLFEMYLDSAPDYILVQSDVLALVNLCYVTQRLIELDHELYEDPSKSTQMGPQGVEQVSALEKLRASLVDRQAKQLTLLRLAPKSRIAGHDMPRPDSAFRKPSRKDRENVVEGEKSFDPTVLLGGRRR